MSHHGPVHSCHADVAWGIGHRADHGAWHCAVCRAMYQQHMTPEVQKIMEGYRIGDLVSHLLLLHFRHIACSSCMLLEIAHACEHSASKCICICIAMSNTSDPPLLSMILNKARPNQVINMFPIVWGCQQEGGAQQAVAQDPYANEPKRHRSLVVRTEKPFNAEPPLELLAAHPMTANDFFYIRNHLPVPHVNAATYKVCLSLCMCWSHEQWWVK